MNKAHFLRRTVAVGLFVALFVAFVAHGQDSAAPMISVKPNGIFFKEPKRIEDLTGFSTDRLSQCLLVEHKTGIGSADLTSRLDVAFQIGNDNGKRVFITINTPKGYASLLQKLATIPRVKSDFMMKLSRLGPTSIECPNNDRLCCETDATNQCVKYQCGSCP